MRSKQHRCTSFLKKMLFIRCIVKKIKIELHIFKHFTIIKLFKTGKIDCNGKVQFF